MSTVDYALPTKPLLLNHGSDMPAWLGDYDEYDSGRELNIIDAMAASGDYFITLATRLDKIAQGLPLDSSEQIELEHQVKMLFYMQEHYDILAKRKRQTRR